MTIEEIISEIEKIAENYSDWKVTYCDSYHHNLVCKHCGHTLYHRSNLVLTPVERCPHCLSIMGDKTITALKEAISALKKQIPAKPQMSRCCKFNIIKMQVVDWIYICPDCHRPVYKYEHHCRCGKMLLW